MSKGDWFEIEDRIFEVQAVTSEFYVVKEVLYKLPTFKLQYGKPRWFWKDVIDGDF